MTTKLMIGRKDKILPNNDLFFVLSFWTIVITPTIMIIAKSNKKKIPDKEVPISQPPKLMVKSTNSIARKISKFKISMMVLIVDINYFFI